MIELLFGMLTGMILGAIGGLIPGLHPNSIAVFVIGLSGLLNPTGFMAMLVSLLLTANFFEFIKTTFLGVPDEGDVLAAYPAHKLVLKGRGEEAVRLMCYGAIGTLLIGLSLLIPLITLIPLIYRRIEEFIPILLILISLHLILKEGKRIHKAIIIFTLSGVLGTIVLRSQLLSEPLLAMLTGFFGASLIIENISRKERIPKQEKCSKHIIEKKNVIKSMFKALFAGSILCFVPAIGPAQSSTLAGSLSKEKQENEYLVSIGGINTCDVLFSLIALFTINKSRSGVLEIIKQNYVMEPIQFTALTIILLLNAIIIYAIVIKLSRIIGAHMHSINYSKLSSIIMVILCAIVGFFNGVIGLIVFTTATIIGAISSKYGVSKTHMMSCLILPTTLFYLGF